MSTMTHSLDDRLDRLPAILQVSINKHTLCYSVSVFVNDFVLHRILTGYPHKSMSYPQLRGVIHRHLIQRDQLSLMITPCSIMIQWVYVEKCLFSVDILFKSLVSKYSLTYCMNLKKPPDYERLD